MASITLFKEANCQGESMDIDNEKDNLEGTGFNDEVSSFRVHSGNWKFYRDSNYRNAYNAVCAPGDFNWVEAIGVGNDAISSLKAV